MPPGPWTRFKLWLRATRRQLGIVLLGLLLVVEGALLFHSLLETWTVVEKVTGSASIQSNQSATGDQPTSGQAQATSAKNERVSISLFANAVTWKTSPDAALLFLALLVGGIGAYLHAITSFAVHLGRGDFNTAWVWWYLLRIFVGAAVALLLYFVVRAGLVVVSTDTGEIDPYGIAAFAGLAGLFSTPAIAKLSAVFDAALGADSAPQPPLPTISELSPSTAASGSAGVEVTITGQNFAKGAVATVDGARRATTYVADTELHVVLAAADVAAAGTKSIVVSNTSGATSGPSAFTITP